MANFSPPSFLLLAFLFFALAVAQNAPEISPTPAPAPTPDVLVDSPPPLAPSPFEAAPDNSPAISPPAPPPADSPSSPPSTTPETPPTPSPSPDVAGDVSVKDKSDAGDQSKAGMNVGKKAGIAVGVIGVVCLVGIGGFIYKKRQDNIRRSQFGFAARRESL